MEPKDPNTQGLDEDAERRRKIAASGGRARVEKYGADFWPKKMRAARAAKRQQRMIDEAVAKALAEAAGGAE